MCMHSTEWFPVYCFITVLFVWVSRATAARNNVLPCWIGPTNCQPKWFRTRSAETQHEEKYFDCWSYHAARWTVNEATWKTVPKPPKLVFWKPSCGNWVSVFEFWGQFGSVFRKPISHIFIGFCTPAVFSMDLTSFLLPKQLQRKNYQKYLKQKITYKCIRAAKSNLDYFIPPFIHHVTDMKCLIIWHYQYFTNKGEVVRNFYQTLNQV